MMYIFFSVLVDHVAEESCWVLGKYKIIYYTILHFARFTNKLGNKLEL